MTTTVHEEPERSRFVVAVDDEPAGLLAYVLDGDVVVMTHTEVQPGHDGQGVGSALVREALHAVRDSGRQVRPLCPFVAAWLRRHPDELDVVEPASRAALEQHDA